MCEIKHSFHGVCVKHCKRQTNEDDPVKKTDFHFSSHIYPHTFTHSHTPCFIIRLIGIRVVLEHGSVAKATTAGGTERREKDREERGKGEGEQ